MLLRYLSTNGCLQKTFPKWDRGRLFKNWSYWPSQSKNQKLATNSRREWSKLGQAIKNSRKTFIVTNFFILIKFTTFYNFLYFEGQIIKIKIQKIFIFWINLRQTIKIQKNFIYSTNLCFSSSKRFLYCSRPCWHFFSFPCSERFLYLSRAYWHLFSFFKNDFSTFHEPFLKIFLCFFDNNYLSFLYIEKKITKKYFNNFFICFKI